MSAAPVPPDGETNTAGIEAAKQAIYETMPVVLKDLVARSEAEAAIGVPHGAGVPDRWLADVAVRAYLAAGRAAASTCDAELDMIERAWSLISEVMVLAKCSQTTEWLTHAKAWQLDYENGPYCAPTAEAWDAGRAAENARIVAALRAKGTHAADVLADQVEREAP